MSVEAPSRVALVAGAGGVVGRALIEHLSADPQWHRVVGLARRGGPQYVRLSHVAVDLLDAASCARVASSLQDVTHVFYAAYLPATDLATECRLNMAMLDNLVTALEPLAPHLSHIQLMQGSKWYGNHLGPYRTPALEDDQRHKAPCFYYDQQDWLAARQKSRAWSWSAVRPHGVLGLAIGSSMNQLTAMALYASVMKELAQPLRWPGSEAAFDTLYQFTEAAYLARGAAWIASNRSLENTAVNFTNGDTVRWRHLWPAIAQAFGMKAAPPAPQSLAETMPGHEPLWTTMRARYGLADYTMADLTNWRFADFVFHCGYDQMSDLTRLRNAGWQGVNSSEAMYVRLVGDLRARRIIP